MNVLNAKKEQTQQVEDGIQNTTSNGGGGSANINTAHLKNEIIDSLKAAVPNQLASTFRDSFKNVLLPAFDKACKEMFSQVRS